VGSYDRHLELLSAAVAGQSSTTAGGLEDDGGGLSPGKRDPGSPDQGGGASAFSLCETWEPDSDRGRVDQPEDEGDFDPRDDVHRPTTTSIGVDVRKFWQRESQAEGAEVLPSHIDFMRAKARGVSGCGVVHKKSTSFYHKSKTTSFWSNHQTTMKYWSIGPESPVHSIWTLFSLIFIAYDFLTLPLAISFDIDGVLFAQINLVGSLFWTVDIVVQFMTGYYKAEAIERRLQMIAKRYLRTWFALDALVVGTDWICIILAFGSRGSGVARLAKLPRFVRAIKVFKIFSQAETIFVSSSAGALADNSRFFLVIVVFTHFIACGWHFLGSWQQAYRRSWLDHEGIDGTGNSYLYVVSFQWSLSQFTPGATPYHAENIAEWLYTSMVLFFGLVVYSSFLGGITSSLTYMRTQTLRHYRNERQLRDYMQRNRVSEAICKKMNEVKRYRYIGGKYMPTFSDIPGLQAFPPSLLAEIKWSVYNHCIRYHPLFDNAMLVSAGGAHKICAEAVSELSYRWGDELFRVGCLAKQMLFVMRGCLAYSTKAGHDGDRRNPANFAGVGGAKLMRHLTGKLELGDSAGPEENLDTLFIRAGRAQNAQYPWISEVALWCVWTHHGTLVGKDNCTVLALTPESLYDAVATDMPMLEALRCYAQAFASSLAEEVLSSTHDTYIDIVNDYWGGDGAHEWADQAVTRAQEEFARIEKQMLRSHSGHSAPSDSAVVVARQRGGLIAGA
jgi:hypothetical protein